MSPPRLLNLLSAALPLLVAVLIARLWLGGTLGYYVNDRTIWIVLLGGVLFAAVGIVAIARDLREPHDRVHFSWKSAVFLVTVLVGLFVPARPLSAGSGQSSSLGALQLASHVSSGTPGDAFGYWVSAISQHSEASWWAGQHVTLVGFATKQAGLPAHGFIVGRYLVTCCVVDATMFGFPVELAHGSPPADGAWVQVSGVFGGRFWSDASGNQWPIIEHARIAPVSIPSTPYLSP